MNNIFLSFNIHANRIFKQAIIISGVFLIHLVLAPHIVTIYSQTFTKITTGDIVNDGGNSTGGSWGDYDYDGDLDLFVTGEDPSRTGNTENYLYKNNGNGTFNLVTESGIAGYGSSRSSSWGDYDKDGDLDLFVTELHGNNKLYANDGPPNYTFTQIIKGEIVNDNE